MDENGNVTGYTGSNADVVIPSEIEGKPVTAIGESVFSGCDSITSAFIPDGITEIPYHAFTCIAAEYIEISEKYKDYCEWAFIWCMELTSVKICVAAYIGEYAFGYCMNLETAELSSEVTGIGEEAFRGCSALKNITIPESVTTIGWSAFQNVEIESIVLPDSVTVIGSRG